MHLFHCFQSYFNDEYDDKVGFNLATRNERGVWPGTEAAELIVKQIGLVKSGIKITRDNGKPTDLQKYVLWKLQNDNKEKAKRLVQEESKGNSEMHL